MLAIDLIQDFHHGLLGDVDGSDALELGGGLEASHLTLAPARRLMRDLGAVVRVLNRTAARADSVATGPGSCRNSAPLDLNVTMPTTLRGEVDGSPTIVVFRVGVCASADQDAREIDLPCSSVRRASAT